MAHEKLDLSRFDMTNPLVDELLLQIGDHNVREDARRHLKLLFKVVRSEDMLDQIGLVKGLNDALQAVEMLHEKVCPSHALTGMVFDLIGAGSTIDQAVAASGVSREQAEKATTTRRRAFALFAADPDLMLEAVYAYMMVYELMQAATVVDTIATAMPHPTQDEKERGN